MTASVVVLDYGSGNLRSAERALARVGADVIVTADLAAAADADGLVVPGVGAFAACMAGIEAVGAAPVIAGRVATGRPVLGICVGMQVLFERGFEAPATPGGGGDGTVATSGLGLLPGEVRRLGADRVPHMGWNEVSPPAGTSLFAGTPTGTRFYFVHSYAATRTAGLVTEAVHGSPFVAAVEHGALSATQFHPEKSGDAGAALLANWVGSLR